MLGQSFGDCDVAVKVPVKVPGTFTQGLSPRDFHLHWDFDLVKFYQVRTSYLYILVCTEDMPLYTGIYQSVHSIYQSVHILGKSLNRALNRVLNWAQVPVTLGLSLALGL